MLKFIFTCGDINGIGPEIVIKTLNRIYGVKEAKYFFACPRNVFEKISEVTSPVFPFRIEKLRNITSSEDVTIIDIGNCRTEWGIPTKYSGKAAVEAIRVAFNYVSRQKADAMITAPISKTAINKAGFEYPGHTEMIAEWSEVKNFVMMFLSHKMNAALVTIHEPLKKVSSLITKKLLEDKFQVIIHSLQKDMNIDFPKAAVLGLNPHAGESGIIGSEEERVIIPAIKASRFSEHLHGPFSPDAFFANKLYETFDIVIGMYHDQVLIPFKLLNFSSGVNYTAGLPIVRTSPDHGTAYDITLQNKADETSLYEAYLYAEKIVEHRKLIVL